jgi:hypothetical protein
MTKGQPSRQWHTFTDDQTGVEVRQLTNTSQTATTCTSQPGWYDGGRRLLFARPRQPY